MAFYIFGVLLIPVAFLGVIMLIWAVLDRKHRIYTVTNKRVIQKRGIIGKDMSEIDLKDIRNVVVSYGVIDRLVGIGNVGLGTAARSGMEIELAGCIDPERVRQIIVDAKG